MMSFDYEGESPPELVVPIPQLFNDLEMWEDFFQLDVPVQIPLRHRKTSSVCYGICDASGRGYGNMI